MTKQFIPIIQKRSRLSYVSKYWGGLLNVQARYYVKRVESNTNPLTKLLEKQE